MKLFIITRKHIMLCLCLVALVVVVTVFSVTSFANTDRLLPIYCVETDKKQIAISFDAAWGNTKKVQNPSNPHKT